MTERVAFGLRGLDQVAFAGRGGELAQLDAALERAARLRVPQRVTVCGAAGTGKSRLCRAWRDRLRGAGDPAGARAMRVAAPARDGGETYDVVAALVRLRFGLQDAADASQATIQLRDYLQRVFGDRRVVEMSSLLGSLIGLEVPESPLAGLLVRRAPRQDDLALAVLARVLERDAAAAPLVIVLEDLDRADDRSLDRLQALAGELAEGALLIVATARPELLVRRPSWGGEGNHTRLDLGPLARPELEALMRAMLGDDDLVPAFADRAAAESGGNPALLEQLLRVYQQHGILTVEEQVGAHAGARGWMIDLERVARETMALTPEEAAQKRIAALSDVERELLARGATLGPVFWTGAVVALGRLGVEPADGVRVFAPDPVIRAIQQTLGSLRDRGYLHGPAESTIAGEIEWRFQSGAELEAVRAQADPALMRRRKAFAAQWLESHLASSSGADVADGLLAREQRFAQLAELYQAAGDRRRAAYCFLSAAGLARARLPLEDAHRLYLRAIELLGEDDAVAKLDALHMAGDLAARLGRTREAIGHFQQFLRLAWWLDMPAKGGAAHDRLGRLHGLLGEHPAALGHLTLARELFELAGDLPGIASSLDDLGRIHFLAGAPAESLEHHRAALVARERLGDDRGRALTLARLGQVEHESGALAPAGEHFREALELRRKIGDRQGEVCSLLDLGGLERDLGSIDRARALLDEGRAIAREIGDRLLECSLGIEIGDCHLLRGEALEALAELTVARDIARAFGAKHLVSEAMRGIAEAELSLGRSVDARNQARSAFDIAERIGAPPLAGAALRVAATSVGRGAPGDPDLGGAREMFDRAVQILGDAGAELELGRALSAYAEFEERTGRTEAAAELRRQTSLIVAEARRPGRTRTTHEMSVVY
jgi:tetratricopeptide (TPR) repeat protein